MAYFPDMKAHTQGREVVLVFDEDVGAALRKACEHDADSDAVYLARAATIVRRDMFQTKMEFNGSFHTECQEQSLPTSLLSLVAMVLNGPNIKTQVLHQYLSQLSVYLSFFYTTAASVTRRMLKTWSGTANSAKHPCQSIWA